MSLLLILSLLLFTGEAAFGASQETDKDILIELKLFLQKSNPVNQGEYALWNETTTNPCGWQGIRCNTSGRVTGVYLNDSTITGDIFSGFFQLTELTHLDLSNNTIGGEIPLDLNKCVNLRYLNVSHNLISGELKLTGLTKLETLDLTQNRFVGRIESNFPALCTSLVTLNISTNNFSGDIGDCFNGCPRLQFVDLSSNQFSGEIWPGFERLREFSVAENNLRGSIRKTFFSPSCSLRILDLSSNGLQGQFPDTISKCSELVSLNLWGNYFTGRIPPAIGLLSNLTSLFIGNNSLDSEIPDQLLNCSKLTFLDLSRNNFTGDVQPIFGKFKTLKILLLRMNSYTGGIRSSGILDIPNLEMLDLSFNNFSGELPVEISRMSKLKFLILAHNSFEGKIPAEYGAMTSLQALDLSFNVLSGEIPASVGNLGSLLWLMLANNRLVGEIPSTIGNCKSLLWLNLANNSLSGSIPASVSLAGTLSKPKSITIAFRGAYGECLTRSGGVPATYRRRSASAYTLMTGKSCWTTWDRLLKGYGLFPICLNSSSPVRTLTVSGYLQLSRNRLSGEIPAEIGAMKRMSLIHLEENNFSGRLPPQIAGVPLVVLNVSNNSFSGEIPPEIGRMNCLESLDLSFNNFSGEFEASLNRLYDLHIFNASYNPLLSGQIPITGQISTFGRDSFLGDPLVEFFGGKRPTGGAPAVVGRRNGLRAAAFWHIAGLGGGALRLRSSLSSRGLSVGYRSTARSGCRIGVS
ncbi:uncharacterized protein A4U43_C08F13860 [Asparagus officinalis]|nr:uncharacterized protein A4U43_C08F13860 [Asparagus officinalis]